MSQRVIFPTQDGKVALISPAIDCGLTIDEVAKKDVPKGAPYLIIHEDDVPTDQEERDEWVVDFSKPHGYGSGVR